MLLKISKFLLCASLLSVVIVMTSTFFPFIGGKDYFFRLSIELALIFFILWWAFEAKDGEAYKLVKNVAGKPIFIAVTVFVVFFLLASVFAYDPNAAFWSNYERGEGGFQMLHYYAFFALLVLLLNKKEDWQLIFKTSLVAAALMVLYGVFANLGWADNFISPWQGAPAASIPKDFWHKLAGTRFQGSLGNPAYVAPYLMFTIFYTLYLWATSKEKDKRFVGLMYPALALIFLFFFIISQTRGAFLGLGVAAFAFFIYLILSRRDTRRKGFIGFAILLLLAGALFLLRDSSFMNNLPFNRIFYFNISDPTAQTRLWTWGSAWQGFKDRPILGWGPENFTAVFDKYFDPRHYVPGQNTETWFDRAHSLYFDSLSETGILGLLSFLGIFAIFYLTFFGFLTKAFGRSDSGPGAPRVAGKELAISRALVFALPVGYLVQGLVIFDVLPIYINLFLFLAFSNYYFYED